MEKYFFDKRVFRVAFLLMVAFACYAIYNADFDFKPHIVHSCPINSPAPCVVRIGCDDSDPFCVPSRTVFIEAGGTYGEPVNPAVQSFPVVSLLIFLAAFVVNHLLYMRRVK